VVVEYKEFKGWETPITGKKSFNELPKECKEYLNFIREFVGVPIKWIGTGPRREDMITL